VLVNLVTILANFTNILRASFVPSTFGQKIKNTKCEHRKAAQNTTEVKCCLLNVKSTFYAQLLRVQVPKAQKETNDLTVFFAHLGSLCVKAAHKT